MNHDLQGSIDQDFADLFAIETTTDGRLPLELAARSRRRTTRRTRRDLSVATLAELDRFLAERRAMLLNPDLENLRAYLLAYGETRGSLASDDCLREAWHLARTAAADIPAPERERSRLWLARVRGTLH